MRVSAGRKHCILGIDVGGTNIRAALVHFPGGSIELPHETRTEAALGKRHSLHQLAVAAGEAVLTGRKRGIRVTRVGIGLPELIGRSGSIDSHATLKWHADDVRKLLSTYGPVTIESDVRAAALAEASLGRGRGLASVLYVTVGTGISCTLVVDGRPYAGAHGHAISFASGPVFPLAGLNGAGLKPDHPTMAKAAEWLVAIQNPDGGWGENCDSYKLDYKGYEAAPSTASQTAWALLGLMAAGQVDHPAVARGINYLKATQEADGLWSQPHYTGGGFPRVFYLNYHGYPKFFPLWALARYRNLKTSNSRRVEFGL